MEQAAVDIVEIVKNSRECMIYGAGVYGRKLYELLTIYGLNQKIVCFAVSNEPAGEKKVFELPVISFAEAEKEHPKAVIFMAIKGAEELYKTVKEIYKGQVFFCQQREIESLYCHVFVKMWEQPIKHNKICFLSNLGKGYMCNGKYITEELIRQKQDVDIVWAVRNLDCKVPEEVRKVEIGSEEYFSELATSKVWVDNCRKDAYIYKREGQYYIQTWHGSGPLKKVEKDVEQVLSREYVHKAKRDGDMIDLFLSSTSANSAMFQNSFYSHGEIMECGSPRNDPMVDSHNINRHRIYNALGIEDQACKILLFAPTFRRTIKDSVEAYDLDIQRLREVLEKRYGDKYEVIVRFHPDLSGNEQLKSIYSDCIDATDYEDTQELLVISDVLITDYSSILWDFSLQKRPVFLYQNDEEKYLDDRGFYCPLNEWPYPRARTQEELYLKIAEFDEDRYQRDVDKFLKRWSSFDDGHASERAVERIMDVIQNPQKYRKEK